MNEQVNEQRKVIDEVASTPGVVGVGANMNGELYVYIDALNAPSYFSTVARVRDCIGTSFEVVHYRNWTSIGIL